MLKLFIQGMQDGEQDFKLTTPIEEAESDFPEFFGLMKLYGKIRKLNNQFMINAIAECEAKMTCDISLEEFIENITCEFLLSVKADNLITDPVNDIDTDSITEIHIYADDKEIDLTDLVIEELAVHLPMKRIAPELRGKEFKDIHPEYSAETDKLNTEDERWSKLKNLKFN